MPTFETSNMASQVKRLIRSKTARVTLKWAHYRYIQPRG
ncbi:transposase [Limnospira indica PCC 8005]|uniref:Transposase n=1 Tax=Limnospira indica PCC 8005 TaxID=376219 RepID=A0A9P1P167_9CYAN|nr:transposase [Limnospira indica PCC 8005]